MLRCPVPLRAVFVWLLLVLLMTGAATYTRGSWYAIVPGHGAVQSAGEQVAEAFPLQQAEITTGPADTPASASQAVRALHKAGQFVEPRELEKDGSERRRAPRGEPAPVQTAVVDPPTLIHPQPYNATLSSIVPAEPDPPALTVVELSISRT